MQKSRLWVHILLLIGIIACPRDSWTQEKQSIQESFKSEVPPALITLLRSLGKLRFGFEMANSKSGKTVDDSEVLKKISAHFQLSETILIELVDRKNQLDAIERSLAPFVKIGSTGLSVKLSGDLKTDGNIAAELNFFRGNTEARLPVILKNQRMGEFLLSLKSLKWTAKGIDPTQELLNQYIDISLDCQIASQRNGDHRYFNEGSWSEIPCNGSIQYDPTERKWYFKIHITPKKLENIVSPKGESCPQDYVEISKWMTSVLQTYPADPDSIPAIIDHPLGGDLMALGSFDSTPHKEYFSNFLVSVDGDEIYLGPRRFGLVLRVPSHSWIFVCGDTRLSNSNPFIDISFFKIKYGFLNSKKRWVDRGPIKVRWRPISGAADSIGGITKDVPLISDFFKIIRDITAPIQDMTISALGGYDVDKIRLSKEGIHFTSRGKILQIIEFNGNKKYDSDAFEQILIPQPPQTDPNP